MNLLICDDEPAVVEQVSALLRDHCKKSGISAHFYPFSDPGAIKDLSSYDIAFLDIDMGDSSGIDLARTLRRENPGIVIVFLTNFIQYAPEGFEVQAFRYLLKRDMNEKLIPYFEAASKEVVQRKRILTISVHSEPIDIPVSHILYLEANLRVIIVHLIHDERTEYHFYGNLSDLSKKLEDLGFLRVQRSFLGDFLSFLYTVVDSLSLILFLDAFAERRWSDRKFTIGVGCFVALNFWILKVPLIFFHRNQAIKIGMILLSYTFSARVLYTKISSKLLLLLVGVEYLITYSLSFGLGMLGAFVCGMDGESFRSSFPLMIVYGIINYSTELFLAYLFRKLMKQKNLPRARNRLNESQLGFYFLFPCTSFFMLGILLYITTGKPVGEGVIAFTCGLILAANAALLYLLDRMERAIETKENLLALGQQLQLQAKNMEAASRLYAEQRHKVHDFRAHLNTVQSLLLNQEYEAAEQYLRSVTTMQTDRLFLVNSHHAILDALFNTKATEAIKKGISIDFEVNDLSALPLDVSDMVVLFANLLDNATEACEKLESEKTIHVSAVLRQSFFFSVRNTSAPVKIHDGNIRTTKSNPALHGFGLSNIKLILNKYAADFIMDYADGWFQFTGEIEL